jgi:outer membrane immunogenic protein
VLFRSYNLGYVTYPIGVTTDWHLSNVLAADAIQARASFEGQLVRGGLNYHFNWGSAPIFAKF